MGHYISSWAPSTPSRLSFTKRISALDPYYLVPRYYSPEVEQSIKQFAKTTKAELVTIGKLVESKKLRISKGHEVGSAAYGTGDIPFIRTSDIANMEITHDPTFGVSEAVYNEYSKRQDLHAFDILFINDGRYRIGQVCMLTEFDTRIVIQSHFRVLRSLDHDFLDPMLLMYLLRHPVVRLQIEAKTFIQSTIATIGARIREVVLPIPKDMGAMKPTIDRMRHIITERARLRDEARELSQNDSDSLLD